MEFLKTWIKSMLSKADLSIAYGTPDRHIARVRWMGIWSPCLQNWITITGSLPDAAQPDPPPAYAVSAQAILIVYEGLKGNR